MCGGPRELCISTYAQLKRPLPASFENLRMTPYAVFRGEIYLPNTHGVISNKFQDEFPGDFDALFNNSLFTTY